MKPTREEVLRKLEEGTKATELSTEERALLTGAERKSCYQGEVAEFISESTAKLVDEGFPYEEAEKMVLDHLRESLRKSEQE